MLIDNISTVKKFSTLKNMIKIYFKIIEIQKKIFQIKKNFQNSILAGIPK